MALKNKEKPAKVVVAPNKPEKVTLVFTQDYEEHKAGSSITCGAEAAAHFINAGVVDTPKKSKK
jgi:hypothetical protein